MESPLVWFHNTSKTTTPVERSATTCWYAYYKYTDKNRHDRNYFDAKLYAKINPCEIMPPCILKRLSGPTTGRVLNYRTLSFPMDFLEGNTFNLANKKHFSVQTHTVRVFCSL